MHPCEGMPQELRVAHRGRAKRSVARRQFRRLSVCSISRLPRRLHTSRRSGDRRHVSMLFRFGGGWPVPNQVRTARETLPFGGACPRRNVFLAGLEVPEESGPWELGRAGAISAVPLASTDCIGTPATDQRASCWFAAIKHCNGFHQCTRNGSIAPPASMTSSSAVSFGRSAYSCRIRTILTHDKSLIENNGTAILWIYCEEIRPEVGS